MIHEINPEGSQPETHESFIQLSGIVAKALAVKPNGLNILVEYERPEKAGEIFMPGNAKGLEFITVKVIEIGSECKFVQKGDTVIVAAKALINESKGGIVVSGQRLWFTQETLVVAKVA